MYWLFSLDPKSWKFENLFFGVFLNLRHRMIFQYKYVKNLKFRLSLYILSKSFVTLNHKISEPQDGCEVQGGSEKEFLNVW